MHQCVHADSKLQNSPTFEEDAKNAAYNQFAAFAYNPTSSSKESLLPRDVDIHQDLAIRHDKLVDELFFLKASKGCI